MIKHAAFSLHGDIVRYRGEDMARLLNPNTGITDAFLRALHGIPDAETDVLEQDIADLTTELDFLRLEVAKALKFLAVADLLTVQTILERIAVDAD